MHAFAVAYGAALSVLHVHGIDVGLHGRHFGAGYVDFLFLLIEAQDALHQPFALGERGHLHRLLAGASAVGLLHFGGDGRVEVKKVEVVISVALALVNEFRVVPRQEGERLLRLHVLGMHLFVDDGFAMARGGIVAHQLGIVLVAVQLDDVHFLLVGAPAHVGEVAVGGVSGFEIHAFARGEVIHADSDLVAGHARHGILVRLHGGDARLNVHLRIVGHHALVHAVVGQAVAFGAPEGALHDAELVAVHGLSIHQVMVLRGRGRIGKLRTERADVGSLGRAAHVEAVAHGVSGRASSGSKVDVGRALAQGDDVVHVAKLEVVVYHIFGETYHGNGPVGVRECGAVEVEHTGKLHCRVGGKVAVGLAHGEEQALFAVARIDRLDFLGIGHDATVAPPLHVVQVLDGAVEVIVSAGNEVLQREAFQVLCHGGKGRQQEHCQRQVNLCFHKV